MFRLFAALMLVQLAFSPVARASCDLGQINKNVGRVAHWMHFDHVRTAPIKGLCEASIGTHVFYVTEDGKYLFAGNLVSLQDGVDLTATTTAKLTRKVLAHISSKDMIIVGPRKPKRTITVFTDVDCPYCARLEEEVPDLVRHGVRVRYLLFPRTGIGTSSYWRAVAVWCAKDPIEAMDIANHGGRLNMRTCPNPVRKTFALGEKLQVDGTPTIFTDDGQVIGGYLPEKQLLSTLGIRDSTISQD